MNTFGKVINPENITYYLYISGGYVAYNIGDRVRVFPAVESSSSPSSSLSPNVKTTSINKNLTIANSTSNDQESDYDSDESNEDSNQTKLDKAEFGKPKKTLYIAKPVEKLPYTGEIISTKRYDVILLLIYL